MGIMSVLIMLACAVSVILALRIDDRYFAKRRNDRRNRKRLDKYKSLEKECKAARAAVDASLSRIQNLTSRTDGHHVARRQLPGQKARLKKFQDKLSDFARVMESGEPYISVSPAPLLVVPIAVTLLMPWRIRHHFDEVDLGFLRGCLAFMEPALAIYAGYLVSLVAHSLRGRRVRESGHALFMMAVTLLSPIAAGILYVATYLVGGLLLLILISSWTSKHARCCLS